MIDELTGLPYVVKRPTPELRLYSVDFSQLIGTAEVAQVVSVTPQFHSGGADGDPLQCAFETFYQREVFFNLSHGTDGVNYLVQTIIIDTEGNEIGPEPILVKVKSTGDT